MFISFEGIDGCGKSTQLTMLREWLEARGHRVLTVREPGATMLSESIRVHRTPGNASTTASSSRSVPAPVNFSWGDWHSGQTPGAGLSASQKWHFILPALR